jgi:putative membrane protein
MSSSSGNNKTRELPAQAPERLHPLSALFVLASQLFTLWPFLLVALVAGLRKDDGWEFGGVLVGALALTLYSIFNTLSMRYWVLPDEILIKEGLFDRTLRHIPLERVQNVSFNQNVLHRMFGVVELQLESGAGLNSEGKFKVITLARAKQLEAEIRGFQRLQPANSSASTESPAQADTPSSEALYQSSTGDLVRLGLIENKGMVVVGAALYFLSQSKLLPESGYKQFGVWVRSQLGVAHGPFYYLAVALGSLLAILIAVRVLSVALAIYRFHGFQLHEHGSRLRVEHGLLNRTGGGTAKDRICAFVMHDGLLYRWFNRVRVEVMLPGQAGAAQGEQAKTGMRFLAPSVTPAQAHVLLDRCSGINLASLRLQPLHPRAAYRMSKWPVMGMAAAGVVIALWAYKAWSLQWAAMIALVTASLMAWTLYSNRRDAKASGFALTDRHLVIREGWFSQVTYIIERAEIQELQLKQSPFDRGYPMASIATELRAGSMVTAMPTIRYLPAGTACALMRVLQRVQPT